MRGVGDEEPGDRLVEGEADNGGQCDGRSGWWGSEEGDQWGPTALARWVGVPICW